MSINTLHKGDDDDDDDNNNNNNNNNTQITLAVSYNTIQFIMLSGTLVITVWYILVIHWQSPTIFLTDQRIFSLYIECT